MKNRIKEIYYEKKNKYKGNAELSNMSIEQKYQLYNQLFCEAIKEAHIEILTMEKAGIV